MNYKKAATYWIQKDGKSVHMEDRQLLNEIEKFITAHNTCALATGSGKFIRCTPIGYEYIDGKFIMFSEGGLKFQALENNKNVCIAIYESFTGFNQLKGMQITGTAEIIEFWTEEYINYLAIKNITDEKLKKLQVTMHIIKITPEHIDFLCSDFKKSGFDSRQHLSFSDANIDSVS